MAMNSKESKGTEKEPAKKKDPGKGTGFFYVWFWRIVGAFSAFWIVFPEPSDLFFPLGWLDEGLAFILLGMALSRLGISIPFLDSVLRFFSGKKRR